MPAAVHVQPSCTAQPYICVILLFHRYIRQQLHGSTFGQRRESEGMLHGCMLLEQVACTRAQVI